MDTLTLKPRIYINVACMENFNEILGKILDLIVASNLAEKSEEITLVVNGDASLLAYSIRDNLSSIGNKIRIIKGPDSLEFMEFPTLDTLWSDSSNLPKETPILYLHTKGVSRKGSGTVQDWVDFMLYFNVERWENRLEELKTHDCTGVNLGGNPDDLDKDPSTWGYTASPLCYSGNFWWSNAGHIRNLPMPSKCPPSPTYKWRMFNEMWVCQLRSGNYYCCHHSNLNHYVSRYPREAYVL